MALLSEGELFGDDDIFEKRRRALSCCCNSTTGLLYEIPKNEFMKMIRSEDKKIVMLELSKQKA